MKIGHIADIHINQKYNLFPQEEHLNHIVSVVKQEQYDIFVIAGDLFDNTPQTDDERSVIYEFMISLLNISTLKELVVMEGNHDLMLSPNNISDSTITGFDIFQDLMYLLKKNEYYDKLRFINKSGIYESKATPNIVWVAYSLRSLFDGTYKPQLNESDKLPNKKYIGLYHDILKDYAINENLPVRKDILSKKLSLKDFTDNNLDFVIAGDIHQNIVYGDSFFTYSGSTQQVNFGEGLYLLLSKKQNRIKETTYKKYINQITFDLETNELIVSKIPLNNYRLFLTIDIQEMINIQELTSIINQSKIDTYLIQENNVIELFVKVKLPYIYRNIESDVLCMINEYINNVYDNKFTNKPHIYVELKYSGIVDSMNDEETKSIVDKINNTLNKSITDNSEDNQITFDDINNTDIIDLDNIKLTKVLSNQQIEDLFKLHMDYVDKYVGLSMDNSDLDNFKEDLINLFKSEFDKTKDSDNKFYDIKLLSIYTNNFMGLGENNINLDISGIVRIKGTNGVGKTTLYNMVRYAITGSVFDNLKKNQSTKNALLLFNDTLTDNDKQTVILNFMVNDNHVKIERNNIRIWKNNTTDTDKKSINWRECVSTVKSNIKLTINKDDITEIIEDSSVIETYLDNWFKNTINNITILNNTKLSTILNTNGDDLKNLILNCLGIDYLQKLKDNIPNVKESLNIIRPNVNYNDLLQKVKEYQSIIESLDNTINNEEELIQQLTDNENILENDKTGITNELINLGYNTSQVESVRNKLSDIESKHKLLVESINGDLNYKTIPDIIDVTELQNNIDAEFNHKITDITALIQKINDKIDSTEKSRNDIIHNHIESLKQQYITDKKLLDDKLLVLNDTINNGKEELQKFIDTENNKLYEKLLIKQKLTDTINHKKSDLINGICKSCNRAYDNFTEDVKQSINDDIIRLNDELNQIDSDITNIKTIIQNKTNEHNTVNNGNLNSRKSIEEEIDRLKNDLFDTTTNLLNRKDIVLTIPEYNDLTILYDKLLNAINTKNNELKSIQELRDEKINQLLIVQKDNQVSIDIATKHNNIVDKINQLNKDKFICDDELTTLLSKENTYKELSIKLNQINVDLNNTKKDIDNHNKSLSDNKLKQYYNKSQVENTLQKIKEYEDYKKRNVLFMIYKNIIEEKFPESIFIYYQKYFNMVLGNLLEDMNFKLYWHTTGDLYMTVLENDGIIYRPVLLSSGMQTAFLGLSLVYAIHELNVKNNISHIFIDEISGQLNSGKELTNKSGELHEIINYQEELSTLLSKFRNKSIFIVDHVIYNLYETFSYEVVKSSNGNKFL